MEVRDYAAKLCGGFPVLTQEQLDECNDLFPAYLFLSMQEDGLHLYTSCCHVHDYAVKKQRTFPGKVAACADLRHNVKTDCPFCGKKVTAKWLSRAGKRKSLSAYRRVMFLHAEQDTPLYAQAYWAYKDYRELSDLSACPVYRFEAAYRFEPGRALMVEKNCWSGDYEETENKRFRDPFRVGHIGGFGYADYDVIGLDALERSCVRYSQYEAWHRRFDHEDRHDTMIRYLSAYCLYPQMEMLVRWKLWDVVGALVWHGKKNAAAIDWTQTDPRKAFGLTAPELKLWLSQSRPEIRDIALCKRLRRHGQKVDFRELVEMDMGIENKLALVQLCERHALSFRKTVRYLTKFTGPRCYGGWFGLGQSFQYWKDYLHGAETMHYDFRQEVVLYPRELFQAHDTVTEQQRLKESSTSAAEFRELTKKLDRRYSFRLAGFHIRPPMSTQEIIDEGQQLRHCVGGYAQRHAEGKLAILFLRDDARPYTPLVTIEMNGTRLVQIHGYRNEYDGAENPRRVYADIVEPWLAWVTAGSKRNKDGKPVLPKKKEAKTA